MRSDTLELADAILALMDHLGDGMLIKPEYLQCCVELNTPPCETASDIEAALSSVLIKASDSAESLGLKLLAAGTHPFDRKPGIVTPSDRYLQAAAHSMVPVHPVTFATHVHVACPDGDVAIRAMRRLTPCLPALLALGANSPLWHGLDTNYASFRQRLLAANPTYGLPPYFSSWKDFNDMLAAAVRSRAVRNFRDLHWDIRPHGDFGTLEFRIFDAQLDAARNAQIAALVRSLVVAAGSHVDSELPAPPRMPHWIELENHFRASKFGLDADLIVTPQGRTEPARRVLHRLLSAADPIAERFGDGSAIAALTAGLDDMQGATRQRKRFRKRHSPQDVAAFLAQTLRPTGQLATRH